MENTVIIETTKGNITVQLDNRAPETAQNFRELVRQGKYDGSIFHRVIEGFMVQGGDFENANGTGGYSYMGPGTSFEDEFHEELKNNRGTLSMANSGPNTNGSQFFINVVDNNFLDNKHSVFAKVVEGMNIVDEIVSVEKDGRDKPVKDIVMKKVYLQPNPEE
jgi:peptidylprolyl isomerase